MKCILSVLILVSLLTSLFAKSNFEEFKSSLSHFDVTIYLWSNNGSDLSESCKVAHSSKTYTGEFLEYWNVF